MKTSRKSPLKDRPLRSPGQSLEERRYELIMDRILQPLMFAVMFSAIALIEWLRYFMPRDPMPWTFTILAGMAISYFLYRFFKTREEIRRLKLGRDGERAVGQFLEAFRSEGFEIFHDIIGDEFNIDHVLICPKGIFTIETKTWKKPARGSPKISFDGEVIMCKGRIPDRNAVVQAYAQAGWLRELLKESTGKDFSVTPVVLFPGWYIDQTKRLKRPIWVLNPKALRDFINYEKTMLDERDTKLASFHLSRFIRSEEARR